MAEVDVAKVAVAIGKLDLEQLQLLSDIIQSRVRRLKKPKAEPSKKKAAHADEDGTAARPKAKRPRDE